VNADAGQTSPAANAPRARPGWAAVVLAVVVAVYGLGYLLWYLSTPLGRAPQLDGQENLALAAKIAAGTLLREPFYRAMLYPALLAVPLKFGASADELPALAAAFGLLCHFAITLAVALLAARLWAGPRARAASLFAAALWGLNPVALYYSVQVLDTVPALALFGGGLVWWTKPGGRNAVIGGIFLGLAVAARPHYLPVVLIAPLARAWLAGRWKWQAGDFMAWAGAGMMLGLLGLIHWNWAGEFRILPTQGPYNFYAANKPGANGKYYLQQIYIPDLPPGENPARIEQEILYQRDKLVFSGPEGLYWDQQAWAAIKAKPGAWLKLMVKKAYYLVNNFDQYNNFTYAWQQARSPWLAWNFLGWGALLVFAAAALPAAWRATGGENIRRAQLAGLGLVFFVYAGGVLLYYASGRFRLPLAPLLCVIAGGLAATPDWKRPCWPGVIAAIIAAILTFSSFFNAHDRSTYIQDELLTALAASATGDDVQAYTLAEAGLQLNPARPDLRRIAVVSYFNLTLADGPKYDTAPGWQKTLGELQGLELRDETLALVAGMACWKTGDPAQAEKIWQMGADRFGANTEAARSLAAAQSLRGEATPGAPPPDPQILAYIKHAPVSAAN
jgi:hypothetical protein